jgi:hypothetical protein
MQLCSYHSYFVHAPCSAATTAQLQLTLAPDCPVHCSSTCCTLSFSSIAAANADILGNYAQFLLGEKGDHAAAEAMFKRALAAKDGHVTNLVCVLDQPCFSFGYKISVEFLLRRRLLMLNFWPSIEMYCISVSFRYFCLVLICFAFAVVVFTFIAAVQRKQRP